MSSTNQRDEAPVIRIVKKGKHAGHHGGAWKVAYADFVTAMMALFIVLWILGQSEDTRQEVAGYFRDPKGASLIIGGEKSNMKAIPLRQSAGVDPSLVNMNNDPIEALEQEAEKLEMMIAEHPDLKQLKGQISIEITPEGVRVEINESEHAPLFDTGSAKLSENLIEALRVFGQEFGKLNSEVIVEGHTDSAPYALHSAMTNWELATYRANEARKVLVGNGLPDGRIFMVRGLADRKPRFADAADPRNRRISMLLLSPEGLAIAKGQTHKPASQPMPAAASGEPRP